MVSAYRPLEGIVVVELGNSVAGPVAGQIFADLGAKLIKIENPKGGDDTRAWGPPFLHGVAAAFLGINRNKLSATVDFKNPEQLEALRRFLVKEADVVIQNLRPGLVDSIGLGADALRRDNPRLVYCNLGAFGSRGPLRNRPGYDPLMQAFGGIMSITGEEGRPPVRVGPSIIDQGTGMWSVIGVLAALYRRSENGEGCVIDSSLYETALSWINGAAVNYLASGNVPKRYGTEMPGLVPYKVFEASDGYILIAAGNENLFRRLAEAVGHPEWLTDPKFKSNPDRVQNREKFNATLQEVIAMRPCGEWQALFDSVGVPCGMLQTIDQVISHPQTEALGILQKTPDGMLTLVGLPLSFDGVRPPVYRSPPALGADTGIIFQENLEVL